MDQKTEGTSIHITGMVHAGAWNMNPVILHITITATSTGKTNLTVQGFAKEGILYNSHAAEQAIKRLIGTVQPAETSSPVTPQSMNSNINALICITAGIISLLGIFVPYFGIIGGVTGIISGIRGRKTQKKKYLVIGVVLSVIGLVITIFHP